MNTNPYSLSNKEVEILEFLGKDGAIAFLKSSDLSRRTLVLKSFLFARLAEGNTFIFRTSAKKQLLNILDEWGLNDLVLELMKDTYITRDQLDKNVYTDRDYQVEAIRSHIKYNTLLSKLRSIQSSYNENVFGNYSRKKLNEFLYLSNKRNLNHKLDLDISAKNYTYTQNEFWTIRNKIEKASKYFKSTYNFLKTSDDFSSDIYKDFHLSENQSIIFSYLNKFLQDAVNLSDQYRNAFQTISNQMYAKFRAQIQKIKALSEELELKISYFQIEQDLAPKKKVFQKKTDPLDESKKNLRAIYQLLIDAIAETPLYKITCPDNDWNPDVEKLKSFNIDLQKLLKNAHIIIQSKVEEQLEIINANNYHAPELIDINQEQQALIFAINGSKIFKDAIHNLSISSWKNYSFLKELVSKLRKAKLFLEANMQYAIYRSFEFSLDSKTNAIITAMENVKTHLWLDSFEAWYFKALFDKYYIHELTGIESKYQLLAQYKHLDINFESFRIAHAFDRLRYNKDLLHKKIGKNGLDWKSALIADRDGFKYNFPIIVCDEDFFTSEIAHLNYEHLICIENEDVPLNLFANSHFNSILMVAERNFSRSVLENAHSAKNYQHKRQFHLKSKAIPSGEKLNDSVGFNLQMAKYLTYVLQEVSYEKQFYSGKDFSIITCMSDFCSKLLEIELLDHRIKALRHDGIDSGIVDDVIIKDDVSKYLIIQDGFLDSEIDLEWQISALHHLQRAGIKVLSLDSFSLAMAEDGKILQLLEIAELPLKRKATVKHES
ncbi:hypothetical protein [Portibacter marinus]|uniref:hypothetical protein n=1 Tax=Portibacter marinus TaxID=2898660 RepID=UPI001F1D32D1|nr:hypothetical protein [Portibacter marinus]